MKVFFWWNLSFDESCPVMEVVFWWKLSSDGSCLMMKDIIVKEVMKVVYWWVLSIDESCILMKVVYWWKLFFDESCLLMRVVYWWKLSFDERCLLMKVVQWWKLPIDESYNSQRSDILWRFACGDVWVRLLDGLFLIFLLACSYSFFSWLGLNIFSWIGLNIFCWPGLNCKSQTFLLFHSLTCTRFTRLVGRLIGCLSPCQKYLINPYNAIFLKSQWSKDIKNDILDCQIHKYTNTSTQIHKYTNTAFEKGSEIPYIYLYFWKANDPRTSKMIFWTVKYTNTQIQRHKYTNTLWWSAGNTQHVLYFRKARGPRTSKMIFWTVKYTNAKIQIHRRWDSYVSPNLKLWITDPLTDFCTVPPGLLHSIF